MSAHAKVAIAFILAVCAPQVAAAPAPLANVSAAVADTAARTSDNVKLDESRKPAELLRFFGLRQDMQVLDMFGANKYWSEIMAPAIGPKGHITVWQPTQFLPDKRKAEFNEFAAKHPNVTLISSPFEAPNLPKNKFDFAIINLDYHDVYWVNPERKVVKMDPNAWLRTLNAAMKRGGTVGVVDHVANPNKDARATVDKLHRIDPNVIRADFRRAGFQLVASSNMLRNPADDHTLLVFDPKIRGKTDRVVYKFRKVR
jgi:predicted methyltransferase